MPQPGGPESLTACRLGAERLRMARGDEPPVDEGTLFLARRTPGFGPKDLVVMPADVASVTSGNNNPSELPTPPVKGIA